MGRKSNSRSRIGSVVRHFALGLLPVLLSCFVIRDAHALVSWRCGTWRLVGEFRGNDLVIYPESMSEKRLAGVFTPELQLALRLKGVGDRTTVVVRMEIPALEAEGVPRVGKIHDAVPASPRELVLKLTESAAVLEKEAKCGP